MRQPCAFFQRGHCKKGSACSFAHVRSKSQHHQHQQRVTNGSAYRPQGIRPPQPLPTIALKTDPPFPALSAVSATHSDELLFPARLELFSRSNRVILSAKRDGRPITDAHSANLLIAAIVQSNSYNTDWTFEDRQAILSDLSDVTSYTPARLAEVLTFSNVSTKGDSSATLSFQAYIGLLGYFTGTSVLKSAAISNVNALFGVLDVNIDKVLSTLETNIAVCIADRTFSGAPTRRYGYGNVSNTETVKIVSGAQVFKPVAAMLIEYVNRFRTAPTVHPKLQGFAAFLSAWFEEWATSVEATSSTFNDQLARQAAADKKLIVSSVGKTIKLLVDTVAQALPQAAQSGAQQQIRSGASLGLLAAIDRQYDGPGELSANGPRHNNDFADVRRIAVAPTAQELVAERDQYLPVNVPGARHHLPDDSMAKIIDIQFRLLRADMMGGLQQGVKAVLGDIASLNYHNTQLNKCLSAGGGWYIDHTTTRDSVRLPILANLEYSGLSLDNRHGLVVQITADAPPGRARQQSLKARCDFWDHSKLMPLGGLVAIITCLKKERPQVEIAILTKMPSSFNHSKPKGKECPRFEFAVHFINPAIGLQAARILQHGESPTFQTRFLIESDVLFESVRPCLESIRSLQPLRVPLQEYLVHKDLKDADIGPPAYAKARGFTWDLSKLLRDDAPIKRCSLNVNDALSISSARQICHANSKLDPRLVHYAEHADKVSQSDAVIDSLVRSLNLVQGPPGTGKTFTGVELLRVLFANNTGPVLLLAYTNHALDHILRAVHDAGVTRDIVRLGSRSKDEVISEYNLENVSRVYSKTKLDGIVGRSYKEMKDIDEVSVTLPTASDSEKLEKVIGDLTRRSKSSVPVLMYLAEEHSRIEKAFYEAPTYVSVLFKAKYGGGWKQVGKNSKAHRYSLWDFWKEGGDIQHIKELHSQQTTPKANPDAAPATASGSQSPHQKKGKANQKRPPKSSAKLADAGFGFFQELLDDEFDVGSDSADEEASEHHTSVVAPQPAAPAASLGLSEEDALLHRDLFLARFGMGTLPPVPTSKRNFGQLAADGDVWAFSICERQLFAKRIEDQAKEFWTNRSIGRFEKLIAEHDAARSQFQEGKDNVSVSLLRDCRLLGATTTGAAKLAGVLRGFSPKVLLVEEAGQVLEAHILSSLVPSIEHVIAIGDPLQLRPNVSTYEFTMDNSRGRDLYRFDMSLMERLALAGLPMSQLQVQRRMAPPISSLIRNNLLYPNLEDHEIVTQYPDVDGMHKNVYFLDHRFKETGGGESGSSKTNRYEAEMACDLAMYLLKQGYTKEGDIVILCAYLGQLVEIRDLLKGRVEVIVDERDEEKITKTLGEDASASPDLLSTPVARTVNLSQQILLRTVDTYQGEEATIVILSLVRNAGTNETLDSRFKPTIGFLKSKNRSNVALSRARHGMYILGNADQLASSSELWRSVVNELADDDRVGPAWPIVCKRHHGEPVYVDRPGQLPIVSPDGGCLLPCGGSLANCGHACPAKCHPYDEEHRFFVCREKCARLHSGCQHPCDKLCHEECGDCLVPHEDVMLPCGHTATVLWVSVSKALPSCEHSAMVSCSEDDLSGIKCKQTCNEPRGCCAKPCPGRCGDCQALSKATKPGQDAKVQRTTHPKHQCKAPIPTCEHFCAADCGTNHSHSTTTCRAKCLRVCAHSACPNKCSEPCSPCEWFHLGELTFQANAPAPGLARMKTRPAAVNSRAVCPVIDCLATSLAPRLLPVVTPAAPVCTTCASKDQLDQVSDLIMQQTLRETLEEDPTVRLITLQCGHIFTVETLDGTLHMSEFYNMDPLTGRWVELNSPSGFTKRVNCPSCRGPVTSPRYNRATKRALLDLQEQVAITRYSDQVQQAASALARIDAEDVSPRVRSATKDVNFTEPGPVKMNHMINKLTNLGSKDQKCIAPELFTFEGKGNEKNMFGVEGPAGKLWQDLVGPTLHIYRQLAAVVNSNRMPHLSAYEGAMTSVYRQELALARQSKVSSARDPNRSALLTARRRMGAPPPGGQNRFKLEALLQTLHARLKMFAIAVAINDELGEHMSLDVTAQGQQTIAQKVGSAFGHVGIGILLSCKRDADLAIRTAEAHKMPRLAVDSHVLHFRIAFETLRYSVKRNLRSAEKQGKRTEAVESEGARAAEAFLLETGKFDRAMEELRATYDEHAALAEHIAKVRVYADTIAEEWDKFARVIVKGEWYEPVSLAETESIMRAVLENEWRTTGRFYQCPNGHPYVIGDCGQAVRESTCPDCGARIGGSGHQLRGDNTRDTELEGIARRLGGQRNPHLNFRG